MIHKETETKWIVCGDDSHALAEITYNNSAPGELRVKVLLDVFGASDAHDFADALMQAKEAIAND